MQNFGVPHAPTGSAFLPSAGSSRAGDRSFAVRLGRTDSVSTARNLQTDAAPSALQRLPVRASWNDKGDRFVGLNPLDVESPCLNFSDLPLHYGCRWGYVRAPSGQ
jgi:hypothetical protein